MILPLLFAQLLQSSADTSGLMTPGVSRGLATRRAAQISDVRYALNLDLTRSDTASGHVRVMFSARSKGDVIVDFRGPSLGSITMNGVAAHELQWNKAHLRIPARLVNRGPNTFDADFKTLIAPSGAPIIRFHDETDGSDYLYTLLVPSDAHALFPCFDQPDLKARLRLQLVVPEPWTAIANGKERAATKASSSTTFAFDESDPLPTYLLA